MAIFAGFSPVEKGQSEEKGKGVRIVYSGFCKDVGKGVPRPRPLIRRASKEAFRCQYRGTGHPSFAGL